MPEKLEPQPDFFRQLYPESPEFKKKQVEVEKRTGEAAEVSQKLYRPKSKPHQIIDDGMQGVRLGRRDKKYHW